MTVKLSNTLFGGSTSAYCRVKVYCHNIAEFYSVCTVSLALCISWEQHRFYFINATNHDKKVLQHKFPDFQVIILQLNH